MSYVRALLFSKDTDLIEELDQSLTTGAQDGFKFLAIDFATDFFWSESAEAAKILVFDLDVVSGSGDKAVAKIQQIEKRDGKRPIILLGDKTQLEQATLSSDISTYISKTVSKPLTGEQLALEIQTIGQELETQVASSASSASTFSAKKAFAYAAGLILLPAALVAALYFQGGKTETVEHSPVAKVIKTETSVVDHDNNTANQHLIDGAQLEPRVATPAANFEQIVEDNSNIRAALRDVNLILTANPDHPEAYEYRRNILTKLRNEFPDLLANEQFEQAAETLDILITEEPFSRDNLALENNYKAALAGARSSSTSDAIGKRTELTTAAQEPGSEKAELDKLMSNFNDAILAGRLAPPSNENALDLLATAVKAASLAPNVVSAMKDELLQQLQISVIDQVNVQDTDSALRTLNQIETLDPNFKQLGSLKTLVAKQQERMNSAVEATATTEPVVVATSQNAVPSKSTSPEPEIMPSYVLKKVTPKFPNRASLMDIEGWVELSYRINEKGEAIDIEVIDAMPDGVFEKSSMQALNRWRFAPARNRATGEPVLSAPQTTKFQFAVDG